MIYVYCKLCKKYEQIKVKPSTCVKSYSHTQVSSPESFLLIFSKMLNACRTGVIKWAELNGSKIRNVALFFISPKPFKLMLQIPLEGILARSCSLSKQSLILGGAWVAQSIKCLRLMSLSHGWWVRAPHQALC